MRGYLRRRDKIGGYLPLLAMMPEPGKAWTRFWYAVRTIDDESEAGNPIDPLLNELQEGILTDYPELQTELRDLAKWTRVEAELYSGGARSLSDYFTLLYYRAFTPVYICGVLGLPGESRELLEYFAMNVGYGAQLMDDTLDLIADVSVGRIFVTQEELALLALSPLDLLTPQARDRIGAFRRKWALDFYISAYDATSMFRPGNRDLARSWLGFGLRALLDKRIVPLSTELLHDHRRYCQHFGWYLHLFDVPCLPEAWRYAFLHPLVRQMVRTVSLVDVDQAREDFDCDPTPLPEVFRVRTVYGRDIVPVEVTSPNADRRTPIVLAHYGLSGLVPTMIDAVRVLAAVGIKGKTW
jgi:hypothetical protein